MKETDGEMLGKEKKPIYACTTINDIELILKINGSAGSGGRV